MGVCQNIPKIRQNIKARNLNNGDNNYKKHEKISENQNIVNQNFPQK